MAKFELDYYFRHSEEELKAAKLVLAMAATPLLFFLSTLGYLGALGNLTKATATISVLAFAVGTLTWGVACAMCQFSIVSVRYEQVKGLKSDDAIRAFAESAWTSQNKLTAKLFWPVLVSILIGIAAMSAFVVLVIWVR